MAIRFNHKWTTECLRQPPKIEAGYNFYAVIDAKVMRCALHRIVGNLCCIASLWSIWRPKAKEKVAIVALKFTLIRPVNWVPNDYLKIQAAYRP